MKKTLTANIGGTVFHIEEDAYDRLQRYLSSIRAQFAGSASAQEIMGDIEARIAELFTQRIEGRQVVNLDDVEHVIGIMGQPEDYLGEEQAAGAETGAGAEAGSWRRGRRRLFRDPDDNWVGGVLAGVAHYFGFDPLVLRLVYIILLFLGVGWLIYIILWIVVPPADTAAEKLEMRGEPVNVDNIKRVFEEGAERVKKGAERVASEAKDIGQRFGSPGAKRGVNDFFGFLGEMFRLFIRFIGKFFGFVLLMMGASAAVVLTILIIGRYDMLFMGDGAVHSIGLSEWSDLIFLSPGQGSWAWLAAIVFVLVPVIGLLYAGLSLLFDVKGPKWLAWILSPLWIASIVVLTVVGLRLANDMHVPEEMELEQVIEQPVGERFVVLMRMDARSDALGWKARYKHGRIEMHSELDVDGDSVRWNDAQLDIERSPDSLFHLIVFRSARGASATVARERAAAITPEWTQSDTVLGLSSAYRSSRAAKLRMQQVRYLVLVPTGGSVVLDESLGGMLDDIQNVTDTWDWEMLGRTWTMTPKGLEDLNAPEPEKEEEAADEEVHLMDDDSSDRDLTAATVFRGLPKRRTATTGGTATEDGRHSVAVPGLLQLLSAVVRI